MPNLNTGILAAVPVVLPPLDEQRRIAAALSDLDDAIGLNSSMNHTLEAIARALFRSWFVDFDPVHAKMEGRPTGLPSEVAVQFSDTFVESSLGDVPAGWRVEKMDTAFEILSGGTPRREVDAYWHGDIPWFSVKDCPLPSDVYTVRTSEHITQAGVDKSAAQVLPVGTTILTARGTVGKVTITGVPMAMNQSCFGLRWSTAEAPVFTFFSVLNTVGSLQEKVIGSVFDTINRATFATTDVLVPPPKIIRTFEMQAGPLLERIKLNVQERNTLAELRDALLPKLLSGELRVREGASA